MVRITKKVMAINNPYNKKARYIVDGIYVFPTKKKAEQFAEKLRKK